MQLNRYCKGCKKEKPLDAYYKDSVGNPKGKCIDCCKLYNLNYNRNRDRSRHKPKPCPSRSPIYKRCAECKYEKSVYCFSKLSNKNNAGFHEACDTCRNVYKYIPKNAEKLLFHKFKKRLRAVLSTAIRNQGFSKTSKSALLLGADFPTVIQHLKQSAIHNYGFYTNISDYHIDHIIPCASAKTEEEFIKLQHYTNLQLLTPKDNLRKSCKYM